MAGISEALVATAVGLMVAIPAVVAFNYFSRRVRVGMTQIEWVAHLAVDRGEGLRARRARLRRTAGGLMAADGPGDDDGLFAHINVTPLVDVTLVLLIIFMVAAPLIVNVPSIKVNLPKAMTADETPRSPLALTLQRDPAGGAIASTPTGEPTDEAGVRGMIRDLVAKDPELQAIVSADRGIDYGDVMHFVDVVKSLGVNKFALSTEGKP